MEKLAICFDFDKTLTKDFGQRYGFYEAMGQTNQSLWGETQKLAEEAGACYLMGSIKLGVENFKNLGNIFDKYS